MSAPALFSAKDSIVLPFLLFSALLLALLIPEVVWRMPIVTDEQRQAWVGHHLEASNAILARRLIREHLNAPPIRWSADTLTCEFQHGIWYSRGAVHLASPNREEIFTPYEILFIPRETQPLYFRIGSREEGDRASALERAHMPSVKP